MKYKLLLAFLLLVGINATFVSCSDDDTPPPALPSKPDTPSTPDKEEEKEEEEDVVPTTYSGIRVEGRFLVDAEGKQVNLHGFAQTYSPWFNEQMTKWNNYDVQACLTYNKGLIDQMLIKGWEMDFVRLHMDPYWSNTPGVQTTGENDISAFSMERFKKYLDEVFVPMAEYMISKGMYVVMRPPGVCPHEIAVGDAYQDYLNNVWDVVSRHPKLSNNGKVMFELANEPVNILANGRYGADTQAHFDEMKKYFQKIVDTMRGNGCKNVLWIPGPAYQGTYWGFANNPIEGENIGYAVHLYPGWMGSDGYNPDHGDYAQGGYTSFQAGWNEKVQPIADIAPVMITEMDWSPAEYQGAGGHESAWGTALTGTAGGTGFGANFKYIADQCGNVSWLFFTWPHLLAKFSATPPAEGQPYTFLNDPEACPWPCYFWFKEYAGKASYAVKEITFGGLSDNELRIVAGGSKCLIVNAVYENGASTTLTEGMTFVSENESVASVNNNGVVTAKSEGTTNISVTVGDKTSTVSVVVTPVVAVWQTDFSDGVAIGGWGGLQSVVENEVLKVTNSASKQSWEVQMCYSVNEPFVEGATYTLTMKIKGTADGNIGAAFQKPDGYQGRGDFPSIKVGKEWSTYTGTAVITGDGATRLLFNIGAYVGDLYFDDITMTMSK